MYTVYNMNYNFYERMVDHVHRISTLWLGGNEGQWNFSSFYKCFLPLTSNHTLEVNALNQSKVPTFNAGIFGTSHPKILAKYE